MVIASALYAGVTEDNEKAPNNQYRTNLTTLIAGYILFLITLFPFGKTGVEASQAWLTVSLLAIGGLIVFALHLIFNSSIVWRKRLVAYIIVILVAVLAVAGTVVYHKHAYSKYMAEVSTVKPVAELESEYNGFRQKVDTMRRYAGMEAQNRQQVDARYQWEEFERDNGTKLGFSLDELRLNAWTNVIDEKN